VTGIEFAHPTRLSPARNLGVYQKPARSLRALRSWIKNSLSSLSRPMWRRSGPELHRTQSRSASAVSRRFLTSWVKGATVIRSETNAAEQQAEGSCGVHSCLAYLIVADPPVSHPPQNGLVPALYTIRLFRQTLLGGLAKRSSSVAPSESVAALPLSSKSSRLITGSRWRPAEPRFINQPHSGPRPDPQPRHVSAKRGWLPSTNRNVRKLPLSPTSSAPMGIKMGINLSLCCQASKRKAPLCRAFSVAGAGFEPATSGL